MDQMLVGFSFAKCYIDDIIVLVSTQKIIGIICRKCLEDSKK
jgi:hypothetical protein